MLIMLYSYIYNLLLLVWIVLLVEKGEDLDLWRASTGGCIGTTN